MPISAVLANRSSSRAAPSSMEYSVCTCRCTNESLKESSRKVANGGPRPGEGGRRTVLHPALATPAQGQFREACRPPLETIMTLAAADRGFRGQETLETS